MTWPGSFCCADGTTYRLTTPDALGRVVIMAGGECISSAMDAGDGLRQFSELRRALQHPAA